MARADTGTSVVRLEETVTRREDGSMDRSSSTGRGRKWNLRHILKVESTEFGDSLVVGIRAR